jgi:glycosyltransferase involved in cell wall biosynthesis
VRVHTLISHLDTGGAELLVAEFAKVAPEAGIELEVTGLNATSNRQVAAERLRALGVEPTTVHISSLLSPRDALRVRREVARVGADLVHTHMSNADLVGGMAARSLGIPAVSTVHADHWWGNQREQLKLRLFALARRRCAARVLTVSDSSRRAYLARGWDRPEHVQTVHNGIVARPAPGAGVAVRRELGIPEDALLLTLLTTLRPEKGFDVAMEAAKQLAPSFPGLRLLIAGDGPYREGVARLAAETETVILAGHREDVMEVLDATDVLLSPSRFDAFPTALLEAQAASVPIVATRVGGIPEIVEDGESGLLVEAPPAAAPFAEATATLLEDPARRAAMGAAAAQRFTEHFTAESWVHRVRAVYDEVISSRASGEPIASAR